jgi:hypothetical protein
MREAALLLRFRTTKPKASTRKYVAYSTIAKILGIRYNTVQHLCRHALKPVKEITPEKMVRVLSKEHIDFLLHLRTLELWSGKTLKQRTVLFHRKFTDKRIAVTSLRKLYVKHGIKRKKVR